MGNMAAGFEAKIATPLTAAMETAGAVVQSNMLDFITGQEGMQLAGLLYLIAIASGIVIFVSGGNYKWARYLLVGPTLFMFLTTVRSESDGTEWSWGNKEFTQESVEYALRGVGRNADSSSAQISTVFHVWNVLMSEVVHTLIHLLRFDATDDNFNFISKVERYMQLWNFSHITDSNMKDLIQLVLVPECKEYFYHQYEVNKEVNLGPNRLNSEAYLRNAIHKHSITLLEERQHSRFTREFWDWAREKELLGKSFSCDALWKELVSFIREDVEEVIRQEIEGHSAVGQDENISRQLFARKILEYVGRKRNAVDSPISADEVDDAAIRFGINWVIARSLALQMNTMDRFSRSHLRDNASAIHMEATGEEIPGGSAGYTPRSSASLQQFYQSEEYGFRSLYVTAALSMPYLQGLALLILSASFPFFAVLLIIPGRAAGIFTFFGLWAWVKLWDLGYAIVTMIDNMLYSMFPRGPNISDQEMNEPGVAILKAFEVDPNYSYANYYMIISTCMLAVPVVSGVFIKGAGNELVNVFHTSWSDYSFRVAGGVMSMARSLQAQDTMRRTQIEREQVFARSTVTADAHSRREGLYLKSSMYAMGIGALQPLLGHGNFQVVEALKADLSARKERVDALIQARRNEYQSIGLYEYRKNKGRYMSNVANLSRYYSHELAMDAPPDQAIQARQLAEQYYDSTKLIDAMKKILTDAATTVPNVQERN
jgi:hypothetical protein